MKPSHWTFLYVPDGEGGVRTLHVSKRGVVGLVASLGVLAVLVAILTTSYIRQESAIGHLKQRDRQVRGLREEIGELESTIQRVEERLAQNFQLQERANLIAGLGPLDAVGGQVGLGGQEPSRSDGLMVSPDLDASRLREMREHLSRLLRQAEFQQDGYRHVLTVLQEDQHLRDTTPSIRPVRSGYLSSTYGRRVDPFTGDLAFHRGVDFSAPQGTPIYATASGEVTRASRHGSLGNLIEVDHGNGIVSRYGHLRAFAADKGATVSRGELIGYVGNTGRSTSSHLHYEIVRNGRSENPWLYIIRE